MLTFSKYQGTGNDFIMMDDRDNQFDISDVARVARLCDRRFGIGADGLILIRRHREADFEMVYFNSDGKPASLCGNGSRCAVQYAHRLGIIGRQTNFQTSEGLLHAHIEQELVHIRMPDVNGVEKLDDGYFLNTGSPHHICFVDQDIESLDVYGKGRDIRYSDRYAKEGTNVNFVQLQGKQSLYVRTYERGVENETYSCGTGVTASALVFAMRSGESPVQIETLGGTLKISFKRVGDEIFTDIYLIGPAEEIFRGTIDL
jgi:diaminopimelate epimerase